MLRRKLAPKNLEKKTLGSTDLRRRSQHLNRVLERERARADRSGQVLSLVLIGIDGRPKPGVTVQTLIDTIHQRGRVTDEAGVFDKRTAFIMLPDTPPAGARRLSESICGTLKRHDIETSYAIYTYTPDQIVKQSEQSRDRDDDNRRGGGSDGGPVIDTVPAAARLTQKTRRASETTRIAVTRTVQPITPPVRDLGKVFSVSLPRWKRLADIVIVGTAMVVLWPLLVTIGLMIKLDSPGPAVFKQKRAGLGGKPFVIYKFRTMHDGAHRTRDHLLHINEQDGPAFKIKNDPRITKLGAFLRKTSLDELPQLFNVLRGEMTLVGPRPLPCDESDACSSWQRRRLEVTPGLTCIWQVWGRSTVGFDEWVRMDLQYLKRRTPAHDLRILMATVPAVISQRGAS